VSIPSPEAMPAPEQSAGDLLAQAWACYDARRLDEAVDAARRACALPAPRPECAAALGWFLLERGDAQEAESVLVSAAGGYPDSPLSHWYLGLLRVRQKRLDEARGALGRALEIDPDLDEAAVSLAWVLHDLGQYAEATPWARRALAARTRADRQEQLGWLLLLQDQVEEGAVLLQAAAAAEPARVSVYGKLAGALQRMGRFDQAVEALQAGLALAPDEADLLLTLGWLLQGRGQPAAAEPLAERLTRIHPALAGGWHLHGVVAYELGRLEQSEHCFSEALARDETLADARLGRVAALRALKRFDDAAAALQPLLQPEPVGARVREVQVHVLLDRGRAAEARALLHRLLRLQPGEGTLWYLLSLVLLKCRRRRIAALALGRARRLAPVLPEAWRQTGWLALEDGNPREARVAAEHALALAPADPASAILAAFAFEACGDLQTASLHAERAVAGSATADAWRALAQVRLRQGRPEDAEAALCTALQRDPDNTAETVRMLGWLCLGEQRHEEAIAAFTAATADNPDDASLWFGLAEAYRGGGRFIDAFHAVRSAMRLRDDWPDARALRSRIVGEQVYSFMKRDWEDLHAAPQVLPASYRFRRAAGRDGPALAHPHAVNPDGASGAGYAYAVCSLSTRSHLPLMRTLALSARKHFPGPIYLLVLDSDEPGLIPDGTTRVRMDEVIDPALWREMSGRYTVLEQCCVLKSFLMRFIARTAGCPVIYLDADTYLLAPLDPLLPSQPDFSVFLTPHLFIPLSGERHAEEIGMLRAGVYNGGVVGVGLDEDGLRFLDWWADRVSRYAYDTQEQGVFTDQRWLDLVPSLFRNVYVSRESGLNVGHWRVGSERDFSEDSSGGLAFCGERVTLMHMSGFKAARPDLLAQHLRPPVTQGTPLGRFLQRYAIELGRNGGAAKRRPAGRREPG